MPYTPSNIFKGIPGTTMAALTLRPFGATAVPANTKVLVNSIIVTNTTNAAATITLAHVDGSNVHRILSATSVPANGVLKLDGLDIIMEPGDSLQAAQGTANALHLNINGAVVT